MCNAVVGDKFDVWIVSGKGYMVKGTASGVIPLNYRAAALAGTMVTKPLLDYLFASFLLSLKLFDLSFKG